MTNIVGVVVVIVLLVGYIEMYISYLSCDIHMYNIDRCMYNIYLASVSQLNRSIVYLKNTDTDDYYIFYICRARAFFHLYILFFANITNNISIASYIHTYYLYECLYINFHIQSYYKL